MKIHVNTSTLFAEYRWYSEDTTLPAACIPGIQISDNASCYALSAGKRGQFWYVNFVNLWSGDTDAMERPCRLSIRFDELESEAQVRALALAYLDIPLEVVTSRRAYRHSKELAACYIIEEETLKFDFQRAEQWARQIIEDTVFPDDVTEAHHRLDCRINYGEWSVPEVVERLQTTKLQEKQGIRLFWSNSYMDETFRPDIVIQVEAGARRIREQPLVEVKPEPDHGQQGNQRHKTTKFSPEKIVEHGIVFIRPGLEKAKSFIDGISGSSQLVEDLREACRLIHRNEELEKQLRLEIGVELYERIKEFVKSGSKHE